MKIEATLNLERETKGAVLYKEPDSAGDDPPLGQLYLRKTAFKDGKYPKAIKVTVVTS